MEKGSDTKPSKKNQPSPGVSKEVTTDRYATCREEISEIEIASIQSCPIIPDYKEPTASTLPIVVRTPVADFCIDGWDYIEQAKAAGQATIRCHVSQIENHSDTELAIRKAAIRVMPRGGKCSYAELVRNTHRLYQALRETSGDLVLFSHGGDRRGVDFTSCREKNIRVILATRLGKSPKTINKYLQHGECLNRTAMETLINADVPKLFFESFQVQKHVEITVSRSEQKNETAIVEDISNHVYAWLNEFQQPTTSVSPHPERQQSPRPNQSNRPGQSIPVQSLPPARPGADQPPTIDPVSINAEDVGIEFKRIGAAIIEVADNQQLTIPQKIETIKIHILTLSTLIQRLIHVDLQNGSGKGGTA